MATIVRGHHFNINDVATAFNLNKLVSGAIISDLELSASDGGVTVGEPPADIKNGSMAAVYEAHAYISSGPSWSEFNYLLKTTEGLVALFKPLGLESRRFFHVSSGADVPGAAKGVPVSGQGATLRCSRAYTDLVTPRHLFIGSSHLTQSTGASDHMSRLVIKGLSTTRILLTSAPPRPRVFQMDNRSASGQWENTLSSATFDKVAGVALDFQAASDARVIGWLFGGPLYRSD